MPADFVRQVAKKWKGNCWHLPVGLCAACARGAIREALAAAEKIGDDREPGKRVEVAYDKGFGPVVVAVRREKAAAIAALREGCHE